MDIKLSAFKVVIYSVNVTYLSQKVRSGSCGLRKGRKRLLKKDFVKPCLDGRRMVVLLPISVIWPTRRLCWEWLGWCLSPTRSDGSQVGVARKEDESTEYVLQNHMYIPYRRRTSYRKCCLSAWTSISRNQTTCICHGTQPLLISFL